MEKGRGAIGSGALLCNAPRWPPASARDEIGHRKAQITSEGRARFGLIRRVVKAIPFSALSAMALALLSGGGPIVSPFHLPRQMRLRYDVRTTCPSGRVYTVEYSSTRGGAAQLGTRKLRSAERPCRLDFSARRGSAGQVDHVAQHFAFSKRGSLPLTCSSSPASLSLVKGGRRSGRQPNSGRS